MFLVNSCMGHFSAALQSSSREGLHLKGHPLSRSYGVNLPSSLTTVLPSALGYSPHPPVSVLVRIPDSLPLGIFSTVGLVTSPIKARRHLRVYVCFMDRPPSGLYVHLIARSLSLPCPPSVITRPGSTGILTCLPSTTPFGLALGSD